MRSERGGPEYTEHVDMSAGTSHKTCRVWPGRVWNVASQAGQAGRPAALPLTALIMQGETREIYTLYFVLILQSSEIEKKCKLCLLKYSSRQAKITVKSF